MQDWTGSVLIEPIAIGGERLDVPVALAPMVGITDRVFRRLAARFGAPYVVSEMIASREMAQSRAMRSLEREVAEEATLSSVQLAGCEAHWMAEAARRVEGVGARIIDINMGCPAKKVTSGFSGAALMRDPDKALRLIDATVAATTLPVTLKMRLGWDDVSRNAPQIARLAESAGVRMLVVHGRTREQRFFGRADWRRVRDVVEAVEIPVLVNGDICDAADARQALARSGASGVMIGRGAQGAPWIMGQVAAALASRAPVSEPVGGMLREIVIEHYESLIEVYGPDVGPRVARKHLGWWLAGRAGGERLRAGIIRETDPRVVLTTLRAYDWPPVQVARQAA